MKFLHVLDHVGRQSRDHFQAEATEQSAAAAQHAATVKRLTALLTSVQVPCLSRLEPSSYHGLISSYVTYRHAISALIRELSMDVIVLAADMRHAVTALQGGASTPQQPAVQPATMLPPQSSPAASAPSQKAGGVLSKSGTAPAAAGRSPEPLRPRPQSSAGPSRKKSFLGRLQLPKRISTAQPTHLAPAAITRPAKAGGTPLQAQTVAVGAGAAAVAFHEPGLGGRIGAQHRAFGAGGSGPVLVASDGAAGAGAVADEGKTPESDTVDEADVSWATTLPSRPPMQRPASVPLLRMDWGRKTASPSEGHYVPVSWVEQ